MQENRYTESDENKDEQHGRQRPAIKTRHERSREECDGCEGNENRTSAHPALRLGPRDPCVRSLHRVTAGGDTHPPGPSETHARQKASGVIRSNTFTILAGCYAQKCGESICPELSRSTSPLSGFQLSTPLRAVVALRFAQLFSLANFDSSEIHRDR